MTLRETIVAIERVALSQPAVQMLVRNDIYRLNATPDAKYAAFGWTQGQHRLAGDFIEYAFTLFYIDRLTEDKGNEVEIQSMGVQTLANVIRTLEAEGVFPAGEWTMQTFNERFEDDCAGAFASVRFSVLADTLCEYEYNDETENKKIV